jgi:hypothetical protein
MEATDNTGFSGVTYNSNNGSSCLPNTTFPLVKLLYPSEDTTLCYRDVPVYTFIAELEQGDVNAARASFYWNGVRLANNLTFDATDNTVRYTMPVPQSDGTQNTASFRVDAGGQFSFTRNRIFRTACPYVTANNRQILSTSSLKIYPNPATDAITIQGLPSGNVDVTIRTVTGKLVRKANLFGSQISVSDLKAGLYILEARKNNTLQVQRFVKH